MPESRYYFVQDVMSMMEVKESKAYDIIKSLNNELEALGKVTIPGRVPKTYYHLRTDVEASEFSVITKGKSVRVAVAH